MGTFSIWHWLIVLLVVLLLFGGRGKISQIMGDMAKGVKSFKKGLREEEEEESAPVSAPKAQLEADEPATAETTTVRKDEAAKT